MQNFIAVTAISKYELYNDKNVLYIIIIHKIKAYSVYLNNVPFHITVQKFIALIY